MALDPQVAQFLEEVSALGLPPVYECTPAQARQMLRDGSNLDAPREPVEQVSDFTLPTSAGSLAVRHYRPAVQGLSGGIVFFHGGGWVCGDLDTHDPFCRRLANATGWPILAIDYRRAPETPWPGAALDCYEATEAIRASAAELSLDPERLVVGGDSAGGNLAAAVTLMARDQGTPQPAGQLLIYPVTDADFERPSYHEFADGYMLTRRAMQWFWDAYVPDPADRLNATAAPFRADSLSDLAPALVITAECDVLRDEGEAYATRLQEAACDVQLTRYPGMIHGFLHRFHLFDVAHQAIDQIARWLKR